MTKAQRLRCFEKMFLTDFKTEIDGTIYREFIDGGWSGVNFARPAFMEFMELAEQGKVGTLIVKDHSRLGRSRLVVGQLLECGTSFAARDCPASR